MMDVLNSFKTLVKVEQIRTDNNVFRLHYKLTVIMLILFSILLTSKQYFGDPIACQVDINKNVIEAYCWITGTYTNKKALEGKGNTNPGLGPGCGIALPWTKQNNGCVLWQHYYQWVSIVFCLQALLFYLPRYLWKSWEGGLLRLLVGDLNSPLVSSNWSTGTKCELIQYILKTSYFHKLYAIRYVVCEILNLINVITQVFLLNWFLGGQFFYYGFNILTEDELNPMHRVFPKLTKCSYMDYGPSGTLQSHDAVCVLPLNILNEKLFVVLWFWLLFLGVITSLSLVYRMFLILIPKLRVYLLMAQARFIGNRQATLIIKKLSYGDFFVLYHIGKNVNPVIFREVVVGLYEALKTKHPYGAYPGMEASAI